jgi:hypothetical protein
LADGTTMKEAGRVMDKPYAELVTQAEAAVAGVKDPELRRAAFEKVLEDLLSQGWAEVCKLGPSEGSQNDQGREFQAIARKVVHKPTSRG